jgi:hypothetical protein
MISMNQAWDDSIAFIRRESALLIPLALATLYVGDVVANLAQGFSTPAKPNPVATIAILAATVWSIVGQLSIVSLVLKPGQSVGEALMHGGARLGKVLLIALLLGVVVALALTPIGAIAVASGANPAVPESLQKLPGWLGLVLFAVLGGLIWLGIRLSLMNVLIVDRNPGVVESIKHGFALTRGITARLCLVIFLYALMLLVLGGAVKFVAGSLFALVGAGLGSPFAGSVMTALVTGIVNTGLALIATVFLAIVYDRVQNRDLQRTFS